ncbi:MAG: LysR family transcriptional regulator [Desulfobacteraceae bacterium]|nr:LysR family transcriptional regulator [Desulfobacteraceae bacterium]
MELYQLRTFVTVAEEKHLTRAAKRLHTSQPSVSAHIKALEEELGISLFERSKKGMGLTDQGALMLDKARTVLDSTSELLNQAEKIKGEPVGGVKIGMNLCPETLRITRLFEQARTAYPKLTLKLIQSSSHQVEQNLKTGEFDCGYILGTVSSPGIRARFLRSVEFMVAAPVAWKQRIENADAREIATLPWVVHTQGCRLDMILEKHFGLGNQNLIRAVEADDETMSQLVMAGAGIGLMYRDEAEAAEKQGRVALWREVTLSLDLFFACLETRSDDPKIEAMLKVHDAVWQPS